MVTQFTEGQMPSSSRPARVAAVLLSRYSMANQQPSSNATWLYQSGIRPPQLFCFCGSEFGSWWFLGKLILRIDCTGTENWVYSIILQSFGPGPSQNIVYRAPLCVVPKPARKKTSIVSSKLRLFVKFCHFAWFYCYKGKVKLNCAMC